jgi:23S rRNA (guanosine2251-2'-O)-methyltransferase
MKQESKHKRNIVLILDNIRSVHNVGSLFRTAECFGVQKLYLCGTTPMPVDRFGRSRPDMAKVALGAQTSLPWEYSNTTESALEQCREIGMQIVALEQADNAVRLNSLGECLTQNTVALVLGTETIGLSPEILSMCDYIAEIPQWGEKESFNVSIAGAMALYELCRESI